MIINNQINRQKAVPPEPIFKLKKLGKMEKNILTFSEAADYTGMSKSYLYKLTSTGAIPHYKPSGKLTYFNREELEAWVFSNRITPMNEIDQRATDYTVAGKAPRTGRKGVKL